MDFVINIIFPFLSIMIPVLVTLYTVDSRIKAQNKETHQPYLVLSDVVNIEKINEYSYHLTPVGRNYLKEHPVIDYDKIKTTNDIAVKLVIHNIGYGVATNIKFYNLLTGNQVHGSQSGDVDKDQKLFTTFDMQASDKKGVQARVINLVGEKEGIEIDDHIRMLCVYRDLNNNIYDFIISINAKKNNHYDFFAYQPSSKSYAKWRKENSDEYKKIIKNYKEIK